MEELLSFLHGIHPLTAGLRRHLKNILREQTVRRKEIILKSGTVSRRIYFIKTGLFQCYYHSGTKQVCSWFMQEGDVILSVVSFFSQTLSYESIQALEDSVVYSISYDELQHIYKKYPSFNFNGRVLTERYYQRSEERQYTIKRKTTKERYQHFFKHHEDLLQRIPRSSLASYLGMRPETLSRVRND